MVLSLAFILSFVVSATSLIVMFPVVSAVQDATNCIVQTAIDIPSGDFLFSFSGSINTPQGVTVNSTHAIITSNIATPEMKVFDSEGNFVFSFNPAGTTQRGVAVDSADDIYSASSVNPPTTINHHSSTGTSISTIGVIGSNNAEFIAPFDVAIDSTDRIIVADSGNNRIQVFSSAEGFLFKFGFSGSGNGNFTTPRGVTVNTLDDIIVADTFNNRIQVFNSAGSFQFKFGSSGSGDGEFDFPRGIATDNSNNIYVADNNDRIQVFNSTGGFLYKFGVSGTGDGQFANPAGIEIDQSLDRIIIADTDNSRIQVMDLGEQSNISTSTIQSCEQGKSVVWSAVGIVPVALFFGLFSLMSGKFE